MKILKELFPEGRATLLVQFFTDVTKEFYLRELQRKNSLGIGELQRELKLLEKVGLIVARKDGNRKYFKVNSAHPMASDFESLVRKSEGFLAILKEELASVKGVEAAFIFGEGAEDKLEVPLVALGGFEAKGLERVMKNVRERSGRALEAYGSTFEKFAWKVAFGDEKVLRVWKAQKNFIVGEAATLEAWVERMLRRS